MAQELTLGDLLVSQSGGGAEPARPHQDDHVLEPSSTSGLAIQVQVQEVREVVGEELSGLEEEASHVYDVTIRVVVE